MDSPARRYAASRNDEAWRHFGLARSAKSGIHSPESAEDSPCFSRPTYGYGFPVDGRVGEDERKEGGGVSCRFVALSSAVVCSCSALPRRRRRNPANTTPSTRSPMTARSL